MEKKDRLMSLDALRGADMMFITGLGGLITALCVAFGAPDCWLAHQMKHVGWEGLAQHDTIFPLFLFIAGVAWPFSCAAQQAKGKTSGQIALRVVRRGATLVLLGLIFNGLLKFDFAHLRFPSVLAFIGISWTVAALLYLFVRRTVVRVGIVAALMVGYWALLKFLVAPDAPAGALPFSYAGNFAGYVDRLLMSGHTLGTSDPEGLLSMMCGVGTGSFGVLAGELVRSMRFSGGRKAALLLGYAVLLLALGFAWMPWCPVIKKLWTPTFALFAGAYSAAAFALFYWLCDVKMWRSWTLPFRMVGMNAITIYLGQRIVNIGGIRDFFFGGVASCCPEAWKDVVLNAGYLAVCWVILYFLYRKNVFLKV